MADGSETRKKKRVRDFAGAVGILVLCSLVLGAVLTASMFALWYLLLQLVPFVILQIVLYPLDRRIPRWTLNALALTLSSAAALSVTYARTVDTTVNTAQALEMHAFVTVPATVCTFVVLTLRRFVIARRGEAG